MADRIIKGDSGNDVIIQNNAGSRKIEVTNAGDVEVTGDVKTTTVKATNLKANDGTAGLEVADSTGEVTSSGGLKAVNVKATNLKANDGTSSLEIADSTGDIGFSGNTNLKIKLPSAGGIFESDGSTEVLTESGGSVTLKNTTIDSTAVFPAGGTGNAVSVAVIVDQKANNTEGGGFTSGDWRTRDLNTENDPDSIVSISSNQFTLGAGTYLISWSAPAFVTTTHVSKLYSVTDTSDLRIGSVEYSNSTHGTQTISIGHFVHAISGSHTYEIRHRCNETRSGNGFGVAAAYGVVNIFTQVLIQKLK